MPGGFGSLLQAAAITAVLCVLLVLFLRTQLGLSLRATGDNRDMVSASSINPAFTTTVGLCLPTPWWRFQARSSPSIRNLLTIRWVRAW